MASAINTQSLLSFPISAIEQLRQMAVFDLQAGVPCPFSSESVEGEYYQQVQEDVREHCQGRKISSAW